MLHRLLPALLILPLLTACAVTPPGAPAMPLDPMVDASNEPESALTADPSWTEFAHCRSITLEAETFDFSAPIDADPVVVQTQLIAEFPTTPAEMQRGLQNRLPLHPETAMIFEFPGDHNPVLWMKDTPASLDMVFFDAAGEVFYLESGTTPNSRRFLTPEEPDPIATHVLELPAGRALDMNLYPGTSRMILGPVQPCRPGESEAIA